MAAEVAVSLRDVRVVHGDHVALAGISLDIAPGERVALVGPSGAGKTTALRLCTRSVAADRGSVTVLGVDVAAAGARQLRELRSRIGTVNQGLDLVGPLRVVHNVNAGRLGTWTRRRALRSLLRPLEVEAAQAALERMGVTGKLLERTDRLSGGEQQRVALARVLVQEPELVVADEPVSSLDPARGSEVMALLASLTGPGPGHEGADGTKAGPRTLVVSLHDFDLARSRCDRLVGIRAGRVVFDHPAADVTDAMGADLYRIEKRR